MRTTTALLLAVNAALVLGVGRLQQGTPSNEPISLASPQVAAEPPLNSPSSPDASDQPPAKIPRSLFVPAMPSAEMPSAPRQPESPERALVLLGVTVVDGAAVAYVVDGEHVMRLAAGDVVRTWRVAAVDRAGIALVPVAGPGEARRLSLRAPEERETP